MGFAPASRGRALQTDFTFAPDLAAFSFVMAEITQASQSTRCGRERNAEGIWVCRLYHQPLREITLPASVDPRGLGHLSAWVCPVSGEPILD